MHGAKHIDEFWQLLESYLPFHVSAGSLIKTTDNYCVFGEKGANNLGKPGVDIIGGSLIKDELKINNGGDIQAAVIKEMEEEANINAKDILSMEVIGVVLSPSSNVIFILSSQVAHGRDHMQRQFLAENDGEMQKLIFVKVDDINAFLKKQTGYKPLLNELIAAKA